MIFHNINNLFFDNFPQNHGCKQNSYSIDLIFKICHDISFVCRCLSYTYHTVLKSKVHSKFCPGFLKVLYSFQLSLNHLTQFDLNQNNLLTFSILISRRTSDLATDASLIEPQSLAFAPNGDLYIAESDSQRINRYALTNPQGRRNFLSIQPTSSFLPL